MELDKNTNFCWDKIGDQLKKIGRKNAQQAIILRFITTATTI
ncbi:hypothetical protein PS389_05830 [Limosilactobacillus pontis]